MIIRLQESPRENLECDSSGTSLFKRKRIYIDPQGFARIEELMINPEQKTVLKECTTGIKTLRYFGGTNSIVTTGYSYVLTDYQGHKIQWGTDAKITKDKSFDDKNGFSWTFAGEVGDRPSIVFFDDTKDVVIPVKNGTTISDVASDLKKIYLDIESAEDIMQMHYNDCIGLVTSFFGQWGFSYPFESECIIDSKRGYNPVTFKYLGGVIDSESGKLLYVEFLNDLNRLTEVLKYACEKEQRHIRILAYTGPYSSVIKIKDMEYPSLSVDYNLSANDQFKLLIHNVKADGSGMFSGEWADILMGGSQKEVNKELVANLFTNDIVLNEKEFIYS